MLSLEADLSWNGAADVCMGAREQLPIFKSGVGPLESFSTKRRTTCESHYRSDAHGHGGSNTTSLSAIVGLGGSGAFRL
jgi:hypothetical protein